MNMEVERTNPRLSNEDQAADNDRGNWHSRLRLRKSSALSHTVKSTIEVQKVDKGLTKKSSQNEPKDHNAGSKLTFTRNDCEDGTRFCPDGLSEHFKHFHGGKGHAECIPCDRCSFIAPDFTTLQQHYTKHSRLTFETCDNKGSQMPSRLTKHYKIHNKQSRCEKLAYGMHNSCPHSTVPATDSSAKSGVKPKNGEINRNLLADAAGEPQKDALLKHNTSPCHQGWSRRNWWKNREAALKPAKSPAPDVKFLNQKSEIPWTSEKYLPFSAAGLLDENGDLLNPTRTLEETKQFLEKTANYGKKWPVTLKNELDLSQSLSCHGTFLSEPKMKRCATPLPVLNSGNELSGLMEKNNISVPPDCTTKIVGFKMVDGKKHLVLKVIPTAKPEISSPTDSAGSKQDDINGAQLDPHIERPSDQACSESGSAATADSIFTGFDSTSRLQQSKKQGLGEELDQGTVQDVSQVDNTENDCSESECTLKGSSGVPKQHTLSGTGEDFNVESRMRNKKTSCEVMLNYNDTKDLNGVKADVSGEVHSFREGDDPTMQEILDTQKRTDNQKNAARDGTEMYLDTSPSPRDTSRVEHLSSGSMEDGIHSRLITLMSGNERSPDSSTMKNKVKKSGEEGTVDYWNEQKMAQKVLKSPPNKSRALLESNIIDPTFASTSKDTPGALFISPSEHGHLFFQDSEDENSNHTDPTDAHAHLDQNCTMENLEEPYLALLSLEDPCHNPDLYQTLEELPVTTVSHLLDDSEVTYRGIVSQPLCSLAPQQLSVHSLQSIAVVAVTNEQVSLPLMTETTISRKRQREGASKGPQGRVSKSKRRLVRKSSASITYWEPPPPEIERTLRLVPVRPSQTVKVPRLNQPVVVLNHPDTDIPEVANIMRSVRKHKGAVQRVVLSQGTLKAFSELNCDTFLNTPADTSHYKQVWPQGTVKERFILKLKLKRLGGNKFKVANLSSNANRLTSNSKFTCWFCGRLFRNQETWVGHGQRHFMEATRDWNKLFNSERQRDPSVELM